MNRGEKESAVIECIRQGMRYQQTADHLKLDKNQIYKVMKDLVETGRIIKVGKGQYGLPDGPIPEYVPPKRKERKKKADVVELIINKEETIRINEPELPKKDIEEIATRLLGKVGALQPLLLLHKEIFDEIEAITMELTNRIIEVKPLILTSQQIEEYDELKQIKERAMKLAERKLQRRTS